MKKDPKVSSQIKRVRAVFSGYVQGVGFRFTTLHIARSYDVTGYVRNAEDGTVEVVAEGREETLNGFIAAIQSSSMKHYIKSVNIDYSAPVGEFQEFGLRY